MELKRDRHIYKYDAVECGECGSHTTYALAYEIAPDQSGRRTFICGPCYDAWLAYDDACCDQHR